MLKKKKKKLEVAKNFSPSRVAVISAENHKRQRRKAPIRNHQTRKVANAKGLNRDTNLT